MPDIVVKFLSHSEKENQFIVIKTELKESVTIVVRKNKSVQRCQNYRNHFRIIVFVFCYQTSLTAQISTENATPL